MSKQVQIRRGTSVEHESFIGAIGEVTYDTTKKTLVTHDGSTAGGIELARQSDVGDLDNLETEAKTSLVEAINEARGTGGGIGVEDIADDLVTNSPLKALSARQGVLLNQSVGDLADAIAGLEGVITPELFGAKGDGITDDTVAIQAAIDAACVYNKVNLADGLDTELGYLKPDGTIEVSGDWITYSKLNVVPGKYYKHSNLGISIMAHVVFYDEAGNITRALPQNDLPERFLIAENETQVRFSSPESWDIPIFIDDSSYGMPIYFGRRTYRITDRLIVRGALTIQGASAVESILYFDGAKEFEEEIPYDFDNYPGSHSAIIIKSNFCKLSNFALFGYNPQTGGATHAHATTWNGLAMHYVSKEGNAFYNGSERHTVERVRIVGFDSGVYLFAGWNKYFVNCEIINCRVAGINYVPLEDSLNWSCSGDLWQSCQVIGCEIGAKTAKTFETTLQNCVFEYCGRAIHAYGCLDTMFISCWNEANNNNILISGNARFVGGYNIDSHTIDHDGYGYVLIEKPSEVIGKRGDEIIFHQVNGIIVKGVSLGSSQLNLLKNPTFGTIAVPEKEPWSFDAFNVHTFIDQTHSYNNVNSVKLDSAEASWEHDVFYGISSANFSVNHNTDYHVTFRFLVDDLSFQDRGLGITVHALTEADEYIMNLAHEGNIKAIGENSWETFTFTFNSGGFTRLNIKIGMLRRGRFWISSPVAAEANIASDRIELRQGEGGIINVVDNLGNVIGTLSMNAE